MFIFALAIMWLKRAFHQITLYLQKFQLSISTKILNIEVHISFVKLFPCDWGFPRLYYYI